MNLSKENQARDTGLAVTLILLIALYFTTKTWLSIIAICVLVMCMTWPKFFAPLAPIWFGFSHILGNVVSKILLTLVFIIVVSPVGLIRRLLGYDSMRIKNWKDGQTSVFVDRGHCYTSKDLETPYQLN